MLELGAAVVIAVAARGFWAYRQMGTQTSVVATNSLPAANETAGWKTYTNDKYGFLFKYPPTWTLLTDTEPAFLVTVKEPTPNGAGGKSFY